MIYENQQQNIIMIYYKIYRLYYSNETQTQDYFITSEYRRTMKPYMHYYSIYNILCKCAVGTHNGIKHNNNIIIL